MAAAVAVHTQKEGVLPNSGCRQGDRQLGWLRERPWAHGRPLQLELAYHKRAMHERDLSKKQNGKKLALFKKTFAVKTGMLRLTACWGAFPLMLALATEPSFAFLPFAAPAHFKAHGGRIGTGMRPALRMVSLTDRVFPASDAQGESHRKRHMNLVLLAGLSLILTRTHRWQGYRPVEHSACHDRVPE